MNYLARRAQRGPASIVTPPGRVCAHRFSVRVLRRRRRTGTGCCGHGGSLVVASQSDFLEERRAKRTPVGLGVPLARIGLSGIGALHGRLPSKVGGLLRVACGFRPPPRVAGLPGKRSFRKFVRRGSSRNEVAGERVARSRCRWLSGIASKELGRSRG